MTLISLRLRHCLHRKLHEELYRLATELPRFTREAPPCLRTFLTVSITEARNLPSVNIGGGGADPYCIVDVEGELYRTRTLWKNLEPFWAETFETRVTNPRSAICTCTIWDEERVLMDQLIGGVQVLSAYILLLLPDYSPPSYYLLR